MGVWEHEMPEIRVYVCARTSVGENMWLCVHLGISVHLSGESKYMCCVYMVLCVSVFICYCEYAVCLCDAGICANETVCVHVCVCVLMALFMSPHIPQPGTPLLLSLHHLYTSCSLARDCSGHRPLGLALFLCLSVC